MNMIYIPLFFFLAGALLGEYLLIKTNNEGYSARLRGKNMAGFDYTNYQCISNMGRKETKIIRFDSGNINIICSPNSA